MLGYEGLDTKAYDVHAEQISLQAVLMFTIAVIAMIMASVPSSTETGAEDDASVPQVYDPNELKAYFSSRPVAVLKRQACFCLVMLVGFETFQMLCLWSPL